MARSKLFIAYNPKNIEDENIIPTEKFIRYSKNHSSNYIVVFIQRKIGEDFFVQFIFEKRKPEFFNLLKETIVNNDYKIHIKEPGGPESSTDKFVYTRLVCDFKPGRTTGWIQDIEKTNSYNDLNNLL